LGDSVTAAYRKILNLEDAAEMTYRALLLGDETSAFPENQTLSVHN
jgi:L-fuculose-phosphate aldolase